MLMKQTERRGLGRVKGGARRAARREMRGYGERRRRRGDRQQKRKKSK